MQRGKGNKVVINTTTTTTGGRTCGAAGGTSNQWATGTMNCNQPQRTATPPTSCTGDTRTTTTPGGAGNTTHENTMAYITELAIQRGRWGNWNERAAVGNVRGARTSNGVVRWNNVGGVGWKVTVRGNAAGGGANVGRGGTRGKGGATAARQMR